MNLENRPLNSGHALVHGHPHGRLQATTFSFQPPRARIDWRALHGVDVDALVRRTDLDALERVLDVVAYGDIEAEDARNLTPLNFIKLFRIAQLTVEYLLFVQDRLAADNCALKAELGKLHGHVDLLQLKVKEQREEVAAGKKELKHAKRAMRTLEALALAQRPLAAPPPPQPQPEVQVVERLVEDPVAQYKLERMEAEARELAREREAMHREMLSLKEVLAAALAASQGHGGTTDAAVEAARREERAIAEERIQAAVKRERRAHLPDSKAQLSVVADNEECRALRAKLAESLARQRELEKQKDKLELELVHALGSPKRAASPTAQVRHLRAELEAAQAELRALQQPRSRGSPRRSSAAHPLHASGVGSMLEDASEASDARVEQLQMEVDLLAAQLDAAQSGKAELQRANVQLRRELQDAQQQLNQLQQQRGLRDGTDWRASELERLDAEVVQLREQNKQLQKENASLRHAGGGKPSLGGEAPQLAKASAAAAGLIKAQHVSTQREQSARVVDPAEQTGLGSPIEALASAEGAGEPASALQPSAKQQSPLAQKPSPTVRALYREDRSRASNPTSTRQQRSSPAVLSSWQRQFDEEMQCELAGHERQGVVSRFPHSLNSMLEMRRELLGELSAEVERELATYGISPRAQRLTDSQFQAALEELEARRAEARAGMSTQDRQRMDYARETITTHVDRVARRLSSPRPAAIPEAEGQVLSVPRSLKPIRTRSNDAEETLISPRAAASRLALAVGDANDPATEAFYSPLRSGASQISFKSDEAGAGSPNSLRSAGPLVEDEDGTPRSPWAITHSRVFQSMGDSESPLRHAARHSPLLSGAAAMRSPRSPSGASSSPAAEAQRLPRRVPQSSNAADWAAEAGQQGSGSPSRQRSPGAVHRYPPDADTYSPAASPARQQRGGGAAVRVRRGEVADSRDLGTDAAEAVRPAAVRPEPLRGSGGSPKTKVH